MKDHQAWLGVLKSKNFLCLWSSQILSQLTVNLINFVIILRIFEKTQSTVAVSMVWVFYALPTIVVGPFVGTLIDWWEKRRILTITTLLEAVIVLFYLAAWGKVWPIYAVILFFSLVNQFYFPTEGATLPSTVEKKLLPLANSLFLFTTYGTLLLGYSLAGPLVRVVGRETPYLVGAALLFLASYAVSQLPSEKGVKKKRIINTQIFFEQWRDGYTFVRGEPRVWLPLIILITSQMIVSLLSVLAPSFVTEILGAELLDAGLILILPIGVGAIISLRVLTHLLQQNYRKKSLITTGLSIIGLAMLTMVLVVYRWESLRVILTVGLMACLGAGLVMLLVPAQTMVQEMTPEKLRGRVFGVLGLAITLASILPMLLTASIADILGVRVILTLLGLLIIAAGIYSRREFYGLYTHHRS